MITSAYEHDANFGPVAPKCVKLPPRRFSAMFRSPRRIAATYYRKHEWVSEPETPPRFGVLRLARSSARTKSPRVLKRRRAAAFTHHFRWSRRSRILFGVFKCARRLQMQCFFYGLATICCARVVAPLLATETVRASRVDARLYNVATHQRHGRDASSQACIEMRCCCCCWCLE